MQFILVTYDIVDDRRRLKVADLLKDYGVRVQYSVFELWLTAKHLRQLEQKLNKLIAAPEDSVRLYFLCGGCQQRVQVLGQGATPTPPTTLIL